MDEAIKKMVEALSKYNAGYVSARVGEYTIIIIDDEKGAAVLDEAWNRYADAPNRITDALLPAHEVNKMTQEVLDRHTEHELSEIIKNIAKTAAGGGFSICGDGSLMPGTLRALKEHGYEVSTSPYNEYNISWK